MMKTIQATGYLVKTSHDEDWGMHEADDGYFVHVTPVASGVDFVHGVAVQDETCRLAANKIGYKEPFVNAGELYEFCEDGDEQAIAVAELADKIRDDIFERVEIVLTDIQISKIKSDYPSREGDFCTNTEGWVRK